MTLYDRCSDCVFSLQDVKRDFVDMCAYDSDSYVVSDFAGYMINVLDSSLRGRNDVDVVGLTYAEIHGMIRRLAVLRDTKNLESGKSA